MQLLALFFVSTNRREFKFIPLEQQQCDKVIWNIELFVFVIFELVNFLNKYFLNLLRNLKKKLKNYFEIVYARYVVVTPKSGEKQVKQYV